jgi:riboflavin synthase
MFTGLIEELGTFEQKTQQGQAMRISIKAKKVLEHVAIGDSIAVNGVCLTVTQFDSNRFYADVMPQTFSHTNLKWLQSGATVNLERALTPTSRLGGHWVSGHVDSVAKITKRYTVDNAVVYHIAPEHADALRYIVPKGSIAVDGTSLTVVDVSDRDFTIWIIPHTLQQTILATKQVGDLVNLECDLLAKYVEKLLMGSNESSNTPQSSKSKGVSKSFLLEHGFLGGSH